jgi:hypothetical protein
MSTETTPQQLLDLPLPGNDAGASTVRGYLVALLTTLWRKEQGFMVAAKEAWRNAQHPVCTRTTTGKSPTENDVRQLAAALYELAMATAAAS